MKQIILIAFFVSPQAFAECNLPLANAAGTYLSELEKNHLQKYQNNSVCEVLSYEVANCTPSQKTKLANSFNVKEVLGNYCSPHLLPSKSVLSKDMMMKGLELFSWKDPNGYFWFALLPGTNRLKVSKEILESKMSEGELKALFKNIPAGAQIFWSNDGKVSDSKSLELSRPSLKVVGEFQKLAASGQFQLQVVSP